jgi:hypothetical protein
VPDRRPPQAPAGRVQLGQLRLLGGGDPEGGELRGVIGLPVAVGVQAGETAGN